LQYADYSIAKPKNRSLEEYAITLEELENSQMRESEMTIRHDQVIVTAIKDKTDHPIIAMDCEMVRTDTIRLSTAETL